MKQISIIIVISLVGVLYIQAQCTLAYKALSTFKNDTTAFMKYNFTDRALCYKGKTVNDVLNDLNNSKIIIKSYTYGVTKNKNTNGIPLITLIEIYIYNINLVDTKTVNRINGGIQKINAIQIFFDPPIDFISNKNIFLNNRVYI